MARDLCHRGCPYGAYFSTNASTIPAAFATGNLTVRPHSLVNKVIYDEHKQRATGVEIIDTETKREDVFYASVIFLNASTVATTFILLHSTSNRFPDGLGNGSGQIGRNLMDHHKGLVISANVDGFEDSYYYGRRPTNIYIPRFRNVTDKSAGFIRGYHFGASAIRAVRQNDAAIGTVLKESMTEPGGWQMGMYAFGECLPYKENRITLNHDKKDSWGRPIITVDCEFKENEKAMHNDMRVTGKEMLEAAGFKDADVKGSISFPGNANHEMGTARMGKDPKTSVLNKWNQVWDAPNVYVTDGAFMTSANCVNPSLTYMAFTARAADHAVSELKKQNI